MQIKKWLAAGVVAAGAAIGAERALEEALKKAGLNREDIEALDIVIIDSQSGWLWDPFDFERDEIINEHNPAMYKIVQIQEKFDAAPPAIYLSLEKIVQLYKDRRGDNGG